MFAEFLSLISAAERPRALAMSSMVSPAAALCLGGGERGGAESGHGGKAGGRRDVLLWAREGSHKQVGSPVGGLQKV